MLKPKKIIKIATLNLQCGDCIHFKHIPLYSDICNKLGIQHYAIAPSCYVPNTHLVLEDLNKKDLEKLIHITNHLSSDKLRILSYLIDQASEVLKYDLIWGQDVYFSLGYDYVTHYFKGYVIGVSNEQIILAGSLNNSITYVHITLYRDKILTLAEWKTHSLNLLKLDKISLTDKKSTRFKNPLPELLKADGSLEIDYSQFRTDLIDGLYEPPSIDLAPEEVINLNKIKQEKIQKNDKPKRVAINKVFTDD